MRNTNIQNHQIILQLYEMLHCSLARYLSFARPWTRRPYSLLMAISRKLANEHQHFADEIARILESRRQITSSPTFPTEFTYYNDVAIEHLAPSLLQDQRYLMGAVSAASAVVGTDREMMRLLTKLAASLRKYADVLEDLLTRGKKHSHSGIPGQSFKFPEPTQANYKSRGAPPPQYAA